MAISSTRRTTGRAIDARRRGPSRALVLRGPAGPCRSRAARRIRDIGPSRLVVQRRVQRGPHRRHDRGDLPLPRGPGDRRPAVHRRRPARPLRRRRSRPRSRCSPRTTSTSASMPPTAIRPPRSSPTRSSVTTAGAQDRLADGIVVTPSHNPPEDGGFKYNPPHGGPADTDVTTRIQDEANRLLEADLEGVRRLPIEQARARATAHDFVTSYVEDLGSVIDMEAIRASGLRLGVDPLGGASVAYWPAIGQRYGLDLTVTNELVDPQFGFMTFDWDGRIRMDPSSPYAMARLVELRDRFDVAFANDTDADRHGIVTPRRRPDEPEPLPVSRRRVPVWRRTRTGERMSPSARRWSRARCSIGSRRTSVAGCSRSRSGSSGSSRGCSMEASGSVARRAPGHPSCAATDRSGRPTRTASSPACWRPN